MASQSCHGGAVGRGGAPSGRAEGPGPPPPPPRARPGGGGGGGGGPPPPPLVRRPGGGGAGGATARRAVAYFSGSVLGGAVSVEEVADLGDVRAVGLQLCEDDSAALGGSFAREVVREIEHA